MELSPGNVAPRILSRPEHTVSRKNIDSDALKVLYRLKNHGFVAYMVGGGVRDLLLERRPKDFDISTSAHPQGVKRLFRNCFIVGRRFRLCHVRFGRKVIEVSTFRKAAEPEEGDTLIRRDNTFGTPEEDAFRRDFTVNALFYDIATFSVIDWVGGLEDLHHRVIRTIGDPGVRFREDPVRMLRAVALACRLGFTIDADSAEAIRALRGDIVLSSPARILEEIYKILRQGRARDTFLELHRSGLLAYLLPEADHALARGEVGLLDSLGRLDAYRAAGAPAEALSNPVVLGSVLIPLGVSLRRVPAAPGSRRPAEEEAEPEPVDLAEEMDVLGEPEVEPEDPSPPSPMFSLPYARRDLDRLRLIVVAERKLKDARRSPGVKQVLATRSYFEDALRWLEIHDEERARQLAEQWRLMEASAPRPLEAALPSDGSGLGAPAVAVEGVDRDRPRRSRRRRRRRRPTPSPSA